MHPCLPRAWLQTVRGTCASLASQADGAPQSGAAQPQGADGCGGEPVHTAAASAHPLTDFSFGDEGEGEDGGFGGMGLGLGFGGGFGFGGSGGLGGQGGSHGALDSVFGEDAGAAGTRCLCTELNPPA